MIVRQVFLSSARVCCLRGVRSRAFSQIMVLWCAAYYRLLSVGSVGGGDAFPVLCGVIDEAVHLLVGVFDGED